VGRTLSEGDIEATAKTIVRSLSVFVLIAGSPKEGACILSLKIYG